MAGREQGGGLGEPDKQAPAPPPRGFWSGAFRTFRSTKFGDFGVRKNFASKNAPILRGGGGGV